MKITLMRNYLNEDIWHAVYNCPGCGHHKEVTLYSQSSADAMQNRVMAGIHRCSTCLAAHGGHGVELRPCQPERFAEGSYSEAMRRGDRATRMRRKKADTIEHERTET